MLPYIPPTPRNVRAPKAAVLRFSGYMIAERRIYRNQTSLHVQIGQLDLHRLRNTSLGSTSNSGYLGLPWKD